MRWIEEQVNSILSQEGVAVSLVVSVDASDDGTEQWFAHLAQHEPRVTVLPQGGQDGGAAGNFFRLIAEVAAQEADHVAFADQDDIWLTDKMRHAIDTIKAQKVSAYSGNVLAVWDNGRQHRVNKAQPQREWDFLFEAAGPGCTYVFAHDCYRALRQHVLAHRSELQAVDRHDWFSYAFARSRGFKWFIDPQAKMHYRQHGHNHVGANAGFKAILARCSDISDGWWLEQARSIARILELQSEPFVRPWISPGQRAGYAHLFKHASRCRRRAADALFMKIVMAAMWVLNP